MKSVIAQGSTVVKAVEEALKKAGQPAEFFVKLLEDAQAGFLGFGAKKAKIALFFKQNPSNYKNDGLLSQDSYQDLFESKSLNKQIEDQLKHVGAPKQQPSAPKPQQPKHQQSQLQQPRPTQQRPQQKQIVKQTASKPEQKPNQTPQRPNKNFEQRKTQQQKPNQPAPTKEKTDASKLMVRPLPSKNNDSSKS